MSVDEWSKEQRVVVSRLGTSTWVGEGYTDICAEKNQPQLNWLQIPQASVQHRLGIVEVVDRPSTVSTFFNPPVEVTEGRGLVLGLEATETAILYHNHPYVGVASVSTHRLAVLCPGFKGLFAKRELLNAKHLFSLLVTI